MLSRQKPDTQQSLQIGFEQDLKGFLHLHGAAGELGHLSAAEMKQFDIAQE